MQYLPLSCATMRFMSSNFFISRLTVLVLISLNKTLYGDIEKRSLIVKPEGLLIMRVWDFWRRKATPKLLLKYTFLKLIRKSKLDFKDVFVSWKDSSGKILIQRYFHCFTKKELEDLVKESGFIIKRSWRGGRDPRTNIYLVAEKPL